MSDSLLTLRRGEVILADNGHKRLPGYTTTKKLEKFESIKTDSNSDTQHWENYKIAWIETERNLRNKFKLSMAENFGTRSHPSVIQMHRYGY